MPTLPTLTVTDAQATRILAAFKALYGTSTQAETIAAYKKWLEEAIVKTVLDFEKARLQAEAQATVAAEMAVVRDGLPNPPAPPAPPSAEEVERQARIALQMDGIDPNTPPQPLPSYEPSPTQIDPTEETAK